MVDVYGTDINTDWSFTNGDINLISGSNNLGQAIVNRLRADLDTYDIFYSKYGGNLFEHMGDLNIPTIHEYIRIEVEAVLEQEPRIHNIIDCTVMKTNTNEVKVTLNVTPVGDDGVVEYNLVLNNDTVILLDANIGESAERI